MSMSSVEKLRSAIESLNNLQGWSNLEGDRLVIYKLLRIAELEAKIKIHEFLNGLINPPLGDEEREQLYAKHRDGFISNNTGDGMNEERLDAEVGSMSDWEFVMNFGRLSDPEEDES